jgi:hypothetical protein
VLHDDGLDAVSVLEFQQQLDGVASVGLQLLHDPHGEQHALGAHAVVALDGHAELLVGQQRQILRVEPVLENVFKTMKTCQ